jgi:hypothetical protein
VDKVVGQVDLNRLLAQVDMDDLLARVDLDDLLTRVDLDRLLARVDVAALIDRVDVNEVAKRIDIDSMVTQTDLGAVIAKSSGGIAANALDVVRSQAVGLDEFIARWVDRFRRRRYSGPPGPPELLRSVPPATPVSPAMAPGAAITTAEP